MQDGAVTGAEQMHVRTYVYSIVIQFCCAVKNWGFGGCHLHMYVRTCLLEVLMLPTI